MENPKGIGVFLFACVLVAFTPFTSLAQKEEVTSKQLTKAQDGHEFDTGFGVWKTSLRRLLRPLSGSTDWVGYEGTTTVTKVLGGKASLVELVADGPAGHIEALSLRLFNPLSQQWSLNFASGQGGIMFVPAIGEFKNGKGEFYCNETYNDRAILLKFIITIVTPDSWRYEQSFSTDGGKTWEVNWVAEDTRIK